MKSHFNIKLAMTDTPETNACIKEHKHIGFLEEDHWSMNGTFTYTHPIVALCRRLERQRDGLKSAVDCASDLLDAAIAERDEAVRSCYIWQKGHAELVKERDKWAGLCDNALTDWRQADTDSIRALHERNEAREQRDEARQQRDAWKAKFIQQNKDLECETMDPNGTIWDYAKKLQKDLAAATAERDNTLLGKLIAFDCREKMLTFEMSKMPSTGTLGESFYISQNQPK